MWLYIPVAIFVAILVPVLLNLWKNYLAARRIGAPIVISFFSAYFVPVMITGKYVRYWLRRCPWPINTWGKYCHYGWSFYDQGKTHDMLGPVFILVTPKVNTVVVADPAAIGSVLTRWREFTKIPGQSSLAVFGPNVTMAEGEEWSRHRKLTAPAFNEKCSSLVWEESLKQAKGMIQGFSAAGAAGTTSLEKDSYTVALHVLSRVAFGVGNEFGEGVSKPRPGFELPFRDALQLVLRRVITVLAVGKKSLLSSHFASLRRLGLAVSEYERYVSALLEGERKVSSRQSGTRNNFLSMLLAASDNEKASGRPSQSMTDQEILGNIWVFHVAGHDTTANTIGFAVAMMAAHPEVQDWLSEEINAVLGDEEHPDYEETYPKLTRCLATMYETLRVFSAVPEDPRYITPTSPPVTLRVGSKDLTIPADTYVQMNFLAVFCSAQHFSPDPFVWRPNRFVVSSENANGNLSSTPAPKSPLGERVWEPPRGVFIPFSDGPRNCLGQKFAKVEFVAVMATLFRRHRVRPACRKGETLAHARLRAQEMAMEAETGAVALKIYRPDRVAMVWEKV